MAKKDPLHLRKTIPPFIGAFDALLTHLKNRFGDGGLFVSLGGGEVHYLVFDKLAPYSVNRLLWWGEKKDVLIEILHVGSYRPNQQTGWQPYKPPKRR